ncbi:hypothetical protein JTB14_034331 [Gonioctena quinquepunctata]|nr:hypothetical protein JTB14_034331 [Gonioctena quinquepunctata]
MPSGRSRLLEHVPTRPNSKLGPFRSSFFNLEPNYQPKRSSHSCRFRERENSSFVSEYRLTNYTRNQDIRYEAKTIREKQGSRSNERFISTAVDGIRFVADILISGVISKPIPLKNFLTAKTIKEKQGSRSNERFISTAVEKTVKGEHPPKQQEK